MKDTVSRPSPLFSDIHVVADRYQDITRSWGYWDKNSPRSPEAKHDAWLSAIEVTGRAVHRATAKYDTLQAAEATIIRAAKRIGFDFGHMFWHEIRGTEYPKTWAKSVTPQLADKFTAKAADLMVQESQRTYEAHYRFNQMPPIGILDWQATGLLAAAIIIEGNDLGLRVHSALMTAGKYLSGQSSTERFFDDTDDVDGAARRLEHALHMRRVFRADQQSSDSAHHSRPDVEQARRDPEPVHDQRVSDSRLELARQREQWIRRLRNRLGQLVQDAHDYDYVASHEQLHVIDGVPMVPEHLGEIIRVWDAASVRKDQLSLSPEAKQQTWQAAKRRLARSVENGAMRGSPSEIVDTIRLEAAKFTGSLNERHVVSGDDLVEADFGHMYWSMEDDTRQTDPVSVDPRNRVVVTPLLMETVSHWVQELQAKIRAYWDVRMGLPAPQPQTDRRWVSVGMLSAAILTQQHHVSAMDAVTVAGRYLTGRLGIHDFGEVFGTVHELEERRYQHSLMSRSESVDLFEKANAAIRLGETEALLQTLMARCEARISGRLRWLADQAYIGRSLARLEACSPSVAELLTEADGIMRHLDALSSETSSQPVGA